MILTSPLDSRPTRIEYKVLLIVLKAQVGVAPRYLGDAIRLLTSASSLRSLRSMDRRELFVPRTRTTTCIAKSRFFGCWPFFLESPSTFSSCFFLISLSFYLLSTSCPKNADLAQNH